MKRLSINTLKSVNNHDPGTEEESYYEKDNSDKYTFGVIYSAKNENRLGFEPIIDGEFIL